MKATETGEDEASTEDEALTDEAQILAMNEEQDENNSDEEGSDNENMVYISASRLNVQQEPSGSAGWTVDERGRVMVLETSTAQDEKEWFKVPLIMAGKINRLDSG